MLPSGDPNSSSFPPLVIGESPRMLAAIALARQAARSDSDVLIQAESGTGKELIARLIHAESSRRHRPFLAVNCAALPETLLESELFGHVRGAFTGATQSRHGRFEAAQGGTLLLDEIGDMPLSLQPKLLRVLQERAFERLGDPRPVRADVRIIATTNRPLATMVKAGSFRLDLYYRLSVIPLTIPPLRERGDDVLLLAEHFLNQYAPGSSIYFTGAFRQRLREHPWPGNVRELANLVQRVVALCPDGPIGAEHFSCAPAPWADEPLLPGTSWREAEKRLLESTLAATDGNRTRAAEMLGISLRTVRNKIRAYGLAPRGCM